MNLGVECLYVSLVFVLTATLLGACNVSRVVFKARNVVSASLAWSEWNATEDDASAATATVATCHFTVVVGSSDCERLRDDKVLFDQVVRLKNYSADLWLVESPTDGQNVTVCSRATRQSHGAATFTLAHATTAKDDIPPLFHECFFLQNGKRAELYTFDISTWIHAYGEKDSISYYCSFRESTSAKRLTWCKLDDQCWLHNVSNESSQLLFTVQNPNSSFEGTFYAVLENEFGQTESPRATWKKAFQNRDNKERRISVDQGDPVSFTCNIQNSIPKVDPTKITWAKWRGDDMDPVDRGREMVTSLDGILVIFEASPQMNGTYSCAIPNQILGETMLDNPTHLTVFPKDALATRVAVKALNTGHRDVIFAGEGEAAMLQCLFVGRPDPTVLWYKGNTVLSADAAGGGRYFLADGNMTLVIEPVANQDDGIYKCVAFNGIGPGEHKNIRLIVQDPPAFTENLSSVNASTGDNVTFRCSFHGEPKPTAVWTINGKPHSEYQKVKVSETTSGSQLDMLDVDENATCSLSCSVANRLGEITTYAYLKVFQKTKIIKITTAEREREHGSRSLVAFSQTFTCSAETDGRKILRIEWFANRTRISGILENLEGNGCIFREHNDQLNVSCSTLNDELEISCRALNGLSSSRESIVIRRNEPKLAFSVGHHFLFGGNPWLMYASVGVGSLLLVFFVSAIVLAIRRNMMHHRSKKADITQSQMSVLGSNYRPSCSDESTASQGVSPHLKKDLINIISSLLIPRSGLELKKCIGNGHFGRVYMAALVHGRQICEIVAVKTMKYKAEESEMVELFLKEAVLMKDFQHQHVLGIKGIAFADDATPMVVLPYMANGDLRNYILNPELNITILNLLIMGMQVACGMDYLSKHHFVHRDLAARNCMVNENGVVKIADFGMSRQLISCDYYRVENGKDPVPIRWMAPECLEAKIFTTKSDVWAYGVLLWELMTRGAVPYPDAENWQVASLIQSGCLLRQPPFCPNVVYSMMTRCWIEDSSKRPSFEQLLQEMEVVLNVVPPEIRRDSLTYSNNNNNNNNNINNSNNVFD